MREVGMSVRGRISPLRDERGISAVFLAVTMVALFAVGALAIDAGSVWTARRNLITGTDAAALDAARYFLSGAGDPCTSGSIPTAESHAANVLLQNNSEALHDPATTPDGFQVTLAGPCTGGFVAGKVRFDGRLDAHQTLSSIIGVQKLEAFSSSTAAWGYITGLGSGAGLRPINICDQSSVSFPNPLPAAPAAPYYPHMYLWNQLQSGAISQTQYDTFFGTDPNNYPSASSGFTLGDTSDNPNMGKAYVIPSGTNGHDTVHRITMPDAACGVVSGNRLWLDFTGPGGGTIGASELVNEILHGYDGQVDLSPHDCNPSDNTPSPEDCGSKPGNNNSVATAASHAMGTITCSVEIPALSCPYIFPILVVNQITEPRGSNALYKQVAFLFVVLRGFGQFNNNSNLQLDLEFVSIQTDGNIGPTNPSGSNAEPKGVQLCGADHDTVTDRCGF